MTGALWEHLENGWIQMFCVDSVDEDSWYARWKHPADRAWRQTQYDDYLLREVLPLSSKVNGNPFLITAGASFGAYHALNFAFRHPYLVSRTIGMSGVYDISGWTDGYEGDQVYFNNPMAISIGGRLLGATILTLFVLHGMVAAWYRVKAE